jgi:hypothetical protein
MELTPHFFLSALALAAIACGYRILHRVLFDATRLPGAAYRGPSFMLAALKDGRRSLVLVGLLLPLVAGAIGLVPVGFVSSWFGWSGPDWVVGGRTGLGWGPFGDGGLLRGFIVATLATLSWAYATQARNHYFDQDHLADRLVLLGSVVAVWLHPVMVLPAVVLTLWTIHQLLHPRCFNYAWTQVRVPLDLLIVFSVCLYGRLLLGIGTGMVLTALLTVLAASYFIPGVCKVGVGPYPFSWLVRNRVSNLFVTACNYGFLGRFWGQEGERSFIAAGRLLRRVDVPVSVFTLAVELGAVLLLADRELAMWILAGCIVMQAGIACASGIVFWKWCVPCGAMIWVLASLSEPMANVLFTPEHLALSLLAVGVSPLWLRPVELGWEDTGLNSFFRIEAVGRSGKVYEVGRNFLAPYDIFFCQSRLFFLIERPVLLGTLGAQTRRGAEFRQLATAIDRSGGDEARLGPLRARYGRVAFDDGLCRALDLFLVKFFASVNDGKASRGLPGVPSAPKHMLFGTRLEEFRQQEPVSRLRIRYLETFYTGSQIKVLLNQVVREIAVGQEAAALEPTPGVAAPAPPARRIALARAG